jgi:hypothetical protein
MKTTSEKTMRKTYNVLASLESIFINCARLKSPHKSICTDKILDTLATSHYLDEEKDRAVGKE